MSKVLFLGELSVGQTTRMRMRALQRMGFDVRGVDTVEPWKRAGWLARQVQRRAEFGPVVDKINDAVASAAREFQPKWVWAEKQEHLRPETVLALRRGGARCIHFTPDPYFSLAWKRTRLMDAAIREFDALVYCKRYEEASFRVVADELVYMPLGFCDEAHRPIMEMAPPTCDVSFLGGWEPRRQALLGLLARTGVGVRIWGRSWDCFRDGRWTLRRTMILRQLAGGQPFQIQYDPDIADCVMGDELYGDEYAAALSSGRLSIGFLRTICPDQHTTRTFEIPACGALLLADRSEEHLEYFDEGREAEFFSSPEECLDKALYYVRNPNQASKVAEAGRMRCLRSGYDYRSRMRAAVAELGWLR